MIYLASWHLGPSLCTLKLLYIHMQGTYLIHKKNRRVYILEAMCCLLLLWKSFIYRVIKLKVTHTLYIYPSRKCTQRSQHRHVNRKGRWKHVPYTFVVDPSQFDLTRLIQDLEPNSRIMFPWNNNPWALHSTQHCAPSPLGFGLGMLTRGMYWLVANPSSSKPSWLTTSLAFPCLHVPKWPHPQLQMNRWIFLKNR